jgi:hypothetical protein
MKVTIVLFLLSFLVLAGCSSLALKPGNFSWPMELELEVDSHGVVTVERYNFSVNIKPLLYAETKDSVNVAGTKLRMIRDELGYYYITGAKFRNVYVYEQNEGGLGYANKIAVSKNGLSSPALNLRSPFIELVNGQDRPIRMTKDGIEEEEGGERK